MLSRPLPDEALPAVVDRNRVIKLAEVFADGREEPANVRIISCHRAFEKWRIHDSAAELLRTGKTGGPGAAELGTPVPPLTAAKVTANCSAARGIYSDVAEKQRYRNGRQLNTVWSAEGW